MQLEYSWLVQKILNKMEEVWKDIEGYEGLYQVSSCGRVKGLGNGKSNNSKERILKANKIRGCYLQVGLFKEGKRKHFLVHRLVANAFLPNPENLKYVNHKDENPKNNYVSNIEWCTFQYNIDYSKSKQVLCVETNTVYTSTMEAGRKTKINQGHISECCLGKRKTAGGYHWEYTD